MRYLFIIRHAKSSWKFKQLDDHDRPLNKRGQRDVHTMAGRLDKKIIQPHHIYSSSAKRAFELATVLSDTLTIPFNISDDLYTFSMDEVLRFIQQLPNALKSIAVVGHNPAVTQLVNTITTVTIDNLPTSGIVSLACPFDNWQQIGEISCDLLDFDFPKKAC